MDRHRIERRDFPTGRRGYDPGAVHEHLRRVADEFEACAPAPAPSLAAGTSEHVRQILEAAERSAVELRASAGTEASAHVSRVVEAADGMLTKLDALESELTHLMTVLRSSAERLSEGLAELQAEAGAGLAADQRQVVPAQPDEPGARASPAAPVPATDSSPEAAQTAPGDAADPSPEAPSSPAADEPPAATQAAASPPAADSPPLSAPDATDWPIPLFPEEAEAEPEDAGARLIALNMALNGSPRADTRVFLEEHFDLPDVEALLDDVYARARR